MPSGPLAPRFTAPASRTTNARISFLVVIGFPNPCKKCKSFARRVRPNPAAGILLRSEVSGKHDTNHKTSSGNSGVGTGHGRHTFGHARPTGPAEAERDSPWRRSRASG